MTQALERLHGASRRGARVDEDRRDLYPPARLTPATAGGAVAKETRFGSSSADNALCS